MLNGWDISESSVDRKKFGVEVGAPYAEAHLSQRQSSWRRGFLVLISPAEWPFSLLYQKDEFCSTVGELKVNYFKPLDVGGHSSIGHARVVFQVENGSVC